MLEYSSPFFHIYRVVVNIYKINYDKIEENILKLNKSDYLVVKSNAYGFGLKKVLDIAYKCNMKKFCVIDLQDALYIREKYKDTVVLILGPFDKSKLKIYEENQLIITITKNTDFKIIKNLNINYEIEINSGMNRFGVTDFDLEEVLSDKRFKGVYSHNATNDINHINNQLQLFFDKVKFIIDKDIHFASTGTKDLKIPFASSRRIGCDIYQDSLEVTGKIISINYCYKGSYVGYDYAYEVLEDSYVGVLDIGYADGLERNCGGFMVFLNGKYFLLIGKSCMNHSFILLDGDSYLECEVVIIGNLNKINNYVKYFKKIPHEIYLSFLKRY